MKASVWPSWFLPLALVFGGTSPAEQAEEFVRRGNDAFARGDYRQAIREYEEAERDTNDPGLVAFNEATANYRLGQYAQAAQHYRCSLEGAATERLPRALYDLGNSLLLQAGENDIGLLTQAIGCYQDCLKHTDAEAELLEDARANLDLAQHLKAQVAQKKTGEDEGGDPSRSNDDRRNPQGGNETRNPQDPNPQEKGNPSSDPSRDPQGRKVDTRQQPPPGKGTLPLIPDKDELVPMSAEETAAYLRLESSRIARERREHRLGAASVPSGNIRNW